MAKSREGAQPEGLVKSPQDLAAGLFLIALAGLGFAGTLDLPLGHLAVMGPGMVPKVVSSLVLLFGIALVAGAFLIEGERLGSWPLRGAVFVLGAAVIFALTIRPLGLIVSGPLVVVFAACADRTTRPLEIVVFAVLITAFCVLLFHYLLRLPIPVMPADLPYPLARLI
jgi:hypothetical protein